MKNIFVTESMTIKDAMKLLDKTAEKVLIIVDDEQHLQGTITDGDIRRAILRGQKFSESVSTFYKRDPFCIINDQLNITDVRALLLQHKIELLPVVDRNNKVIRYVTWSEAFSETDIKLAPLNRLKIPIVIMAGGQGTRMDPFTKVMPKPLIPIQDKTILEVIMETFSIYTDSTYFLSLNYKSEMIKAYFNGTSHPYKLEYVIEKDFFGTAGSIKLLANRLSGDFIVSNCDVIVKANYIEVLEMHRKSNAVLTILSSVQHHRVPYGVVEYGKGGQVEAVQEKPEYTMTINTGVYVLNERAIQYIPENSHYNMTDLINTLILEKETVQMYPVNENDFLDIGQWDEYRKVIEKLKV